MTRSRSQRDAVAADPQIDPLEADPWAGTEEVPEWNPVPVAEPESMDPDEPWHEPVAIAAGRPGTVEPGGRPDGRLTRARHRLGGAALAPLPLAAACALAVIDFADGWRSAVVAALAAAAVAAARLRFSARAALGLLLAVALLAIAGWGPGLDRRPAPAPGHRGHAHAHSHTHGRAHSHGGRA